MILVRTLAILSLALSAFLWSQQDASAATCLGRAVTKSGSGIITGTPGNDVINGSTGLGPEDRCSWS